MLKEAERGLYVYLESRALSPNHTSLCIRSLQPYKTTTPASTGSGYMLKTALLASVHYKSRHCISTFGDF